MVHHYIGHSTTLLSSVRNAMVRKYATGYGYQGNQAAMSGQVMI